MPKIISKVLKKCSRWHSNNTILKQMLRTSYQTTLIKPELLKHLNFETEKLPCGVTDMVCLQSGSQETRHFRFLLLKQTLLQEKRKKITNSVAALLLGRLSVRPLPLSSASEAAAQG